MNKIIYFELSQEAKICVETVLKMCDITIKHLNKKGEKVEKKFVLGREAAESILNNHPISSSGYLSIIDVIIGFYKASVLLKKDYDPNANIKLAEQLNEFAQYLINNNPFNQNNEIFQ